MPNWCENSLFITGKKKDIVDFLNYNGSGDFNFNKYLPIPEIYEKFDTTNSKDGRDVLHHEHIKKEDGSYETISTPKYATDEEYEKYSADYDAAVKEQKEKYGFVGWYDWNVFNWGTKWDIDKIENKGLIAQIENNKDNEEVTIELFFDTAWSPCVVFLENIYTKFPDLTFDLYYIELGEFFAGHTSAYFEDGEGIFEDECGEPELYDLENCCPITEEERQEIEKENAACSGDGEDSETDWSSVWDCQCDRYDYVNPYQYE